LVLFFEKKTKRKRRKIGGAIKSDEEIIGSRRSNYHVDDSTRYLDLNQ